ERFTARAHGAPTADERNPTRVWADKATCTVSATVRPGKRRASWKLRARPNADRYSAGRSATSSPKTRTRPAFGWEAPEMTLRSLVFAAPLGAVTPTISPAS